MTVRVIGVGQSFAGDDGVGFAVTARLRALAIPELVVRDVTDPTDLIELLANPEPVVIVDALLGSNPGRIHVLDGHALGSAPPSSTHAVSVAEALEIARALHGDRDVRVIAIEVETTMRGTTTLSVPIEATIDEAVAAVLAASHQRRSETIAPARRSTSRTSKSPKQ